MAPAMVIINCDIEFITDKSECIGICIDISSDIEKCISALEAIITRKINSLYLCYGKSKQIIRVQIGEKNIFMKETYDLHLSFADIEIIKHLLLDVFLNNGFPGYHYDVDVKNGIYDMQVSFIMQHPYL